MRDRNKERTQETETQQKNRGKKLREKTERQGQGVAAPDEGAQGSNATFSTGPAQGPKPDNQTSQVAGGGPRDSEWPMTGWHAVKRSPCPKRGLAFGWPLGVNF